MNVAPDSALEILKSATESALNDSEIGLLVSGLVLAVGAIGEYLEEHGKLPRWMGWPKLVFIGMVVFGLIGEFVGDAGVFVFSGHLQTIGDSEIADLNTKRVELAASLLPRDFFNQSEIFAGLSRLPPQSLVFEYASEREPRRVAEQIYSVFRDHNWNAFRRQVKDESQIGDGVTIIVGGNFPPFPVSSLVHQQESVSKTAAELLRDSLVRSEIEAKIGTNFDRFIVDVHDRDLPPSILIVRVGEKPNHVLEETLKELAPRKAPLVNGIAVGSNRQEIPDEPSNSAKP